jgi:hypothetical protein
MRDEVRHRLILARIAQPSMHRLHGLPLAVVEQAVEILTGGVPLRLSAEARAEAVQVLAESSQQRARTHWSRVQRTELQKKVQARFLSPRQSGRIESDKVVLVG